jgi:hypothetical protein
MDYSITYGSFSQKGNDFAFGIDELCFHKGIIIVNAVPSPFYQGYHSALRFQSKVRTSI